MHSFVLVPDEAGVLKLGVLVSVLNALEAFVLIDLVVFFVLVLLIVLDLTVGPFYQLPLEAFHHAVEVDGVVA
jgi:hypothetical protein